jgi:peptidoglycan/LPS O-acetylase OafA/YrhL
VADPQPTKPARVLYLDVLRGIAILLVLLRHPPVRVTDDSFLGALFKPFYFSGWVGVDLFFVLSGFLIGGLLFDEYRKQGSINLKRFWVRRAFKILPPYYAYIGIGMIAAFVLTPGGVLDKLLEVWESHAGTLLFVQNYSVLRYTHTWSLAVEEHFYLLLPTTLALLLWGAVRSRRSEPFRAVPALYASVAVVCLVGRLLMANTGLPFSIYRQYVVTHLRIDSLLAGVCLAYLIRFRKPWIDAIRPARWALLLMGIACFVPTFMGDMEQVQFMFTWQFTILQIGSAMLILFGATGSTMSAPPLLARTTACIGRWSYAIYLWHPPMAMAGTLFILKAFGLPTDGWTYPLMMAIYIGLATLIGAIVTRLIETPALQLRDRWTKSRTPGPPVAEAPAIPLPLRQAA